jgi:dihydropteroate synthase
MGILNLTPDSFSDGGRYLELDAALAQTERMLEEGATFIDMGGYSSRPGADHVSEAEELRRLEQVVAQVIQRFPEALVSIDTFRSGVAAAMLDLGAHLINDISAGELDPNMMTTVAKYPAPYIMMHMKGTPQTMQQQARYQDVVEEVWGFLVAKVNEARKAGIRDLIVDPGFGFGKKWKHNYQLLHRLDQLGRLGLPVLVGISRKSMLYRLLDTEPTDVLPQSTALHFKALEQGANILRVHDVKDAVRVCKLYRYYQEAQAEADAGADSTK